MQITAIPYSQLLTHVPGVFTNHRQKAGNAGIKELAGSIEADGLMNPLQVWRYTPTEGKEPLHIIIGGSRRHRALGLLIDRGVLAKDVDVPCRLVDSPDAGQARGAALVDNLQREDLSPYDLAKEIYELRTDGGFTGASLARRIGKSNAWVSRHFSTWRDTTAGVKACWQKGELTTEQVYHLSKLDQWQQDEEAAKLVQLRAGADGATTAESRKAARGKVHALKNERIEAEKSGKKPRAAAKAPTATKLNGTPRPAPKAATAAKANGKARPAPKAAKANGKAHPASAEDEVVTSLGRELLDEARTPAAHYRELVNQRLFGTAEPLSDSDTDYLRGVLDTLRWVCGDALPGEFRDVMRDLVRAGNEARA